MENLILKLGVPSRFILEDETTTGQFMSKVYDENQDIELDEMFELIREQAPKDNYTLKDFIFDYYNTLRTKERNITPFVVFRSIEEFVEEAGGEEIWDILGYRTSTEFGLQFEDWIGRIPEEAKEEADRLKQEAITLTLEKTEPITIDAFAIRNYKYIFTTSVKNEIELLEQIKVDSRIIFVKALSKYKIYPFMNPADIKYVESNVVNTKDVIIIIKNEDKYHKLDGTLQTLTLDIAQEDQKAVIGIIRDNTTNISGQVSKFSGDAISVGEEVNDIVLLDAITNDPIVSKYLYVDESNKPYAAKKLLYFTHQITKVRILISVVKSNITETLDFNGNKVSINQGDRFIKFTIINATNVEKIRKTLDDVTRIITRVKQLTTKTLSLYNAIIPTTEEDRSKVKEGRTKKQTGLVELKAKDDLFTETDYSRRCQSHAQPKIIDEDELNQWEGYQIMTFPKPEDGDPKMYVCPNPSLPHPGLYKNKDPETNDKYPYFPCCYERDHMNSNSEYYAEYFRGIPKKKIKPEAFKAPEISSDKILESGRRAKLPAELSDGLRTLLGDYPKRVGVPRGKYSFLSSVALALDKTYATLDTDDERVNRTKQLFSNIKSFLDVGAQELKNIPTVTSYDPIYFYHIVEAMFNVNIFILTPDGLSPGHFSKFPSLPPKRTDIPTLIVYRHFGSETDNLKDPQTELIVTDTEMTFDSKVTESLYETLLATNGVISISVDKHKLLHNFNSRVNFWSLLSEIQGQIIDQSGKTQAIITNGLTLFIPPTQPWKTQTVLEPLLANYDLVIKKMGKPTSVYTDGNTVLGLYYPLMDYKEGAYVPVNPTTYIKPMGIESKQTPPYLQSRGDDPMGEYEKLLKSLENVWILMTYAYSIFSAGIDSRDFKSIVENFVNKYTVVKPGKIPTFYGVSIKTDLEQTLDKVMKGLTTEFPNALADSRFILPDETSKEKIRLRLIQYAKSTEGLEILPPNQLVVPKNELRRLISPIDIVLLDNKEYVNWLDSITISNTFMTKLDVGIVNHKYPLFYKDEDNHIFMIQNVYAGSFKRSINIAETWKREKKNIGFNAPEIDGDPLASILTYGITNNGKLSVLENPKLLSVVDEDTILILRYTQTRYAALILLN